MTVKPTSQVYAVTAKSGTPVFKRPSGRRFAGPDPLMGRSVSITGGSFKGYLGTVKEATDTTV